MSDARIEGYARALFEVARAEGTLDEVEDELFRFARSYESSDELRNALTDDGIPPGKRQAIVEDLLDGKATPGAEHFGLIVTADGDRARAKPRPTLYLEALERLGLDSGEAIAFEDSPNGVRAAKAAGLYCVAVPNGVTVSLGLEEADLVVDSLAELPLAELLRRAGKNSSP